MNSPNTHSTDPGTHSPCSDQTLRSSYRYPPTTTVVKSFVREHKVELLTTAVVVLSVKNTKHRLTIRKLRKQAALAKRDIDTAIAVIEGMNLFDYYFGKPKK